jgi:hypothetical protein
MLLANLMKNQELLAKYGAEEFRNVDNRINDMYS